jgi:hypothetical protein
VGQAVGPAVLARRGHEAGQVAAIEGLETDVPTHQGHGRKWLHEKDSGSTGPGRHLARQFEPIGGFLVS